MKKFYLISILVSLILSIALGANVFASSIDGTIDSVNRYAWTENFGWIDFGSTEGNVHVTSSGLTGYAWGENIGWINLNCSNNSSCGTVNFGVQNDGYGNLSGYAWGENVGWISFNPMNGYNVSIDLNGDFRGYAWGENIGWIVFNCADTTTCASVQYKVSTDYRPTASGGSGGGGSSPSPAPSSSILPSPSVSPTPTPTCVARPACLDSVPACKIMEPAAGWCPVATCVARPACLDAPRPCKIMEPASGWCPVVSVTPSPSLSITPTPTGSIPPPTPTSPPPSGGGGGGGIGPTSPPPSGGGTGGGVGGVVQGIVDTIGTGVGGAITGVQEAVSGVAQWQPITIPDPVSAKAKQIVDLVPGKEQTVVVVATTSAVTSSLLSAILSSASIAFSSFGNYLLFLGFYILDLIFLRRRTVPWGYVFDSITKRPVPFAKVQLLNQYGEVAETRITNDKGWYGFLVSSLGQSSQASIRVIKNGYTFPASNYSIEGFVPEHNIYTGGPITVTGDMSLSYDIPLDAIEVATAEPIKEFRAKFNRVGVSALDGGFWLSFISAPILYLSSPYFPQFIVLCVVMILAFTRIAGLKPKPYGIIIDHNTRETIPFAYIIVNDSNNKRVASVVADEHGRYELIIPKGDYKLSIHTPGGFQPQLSSEIPIRVDKGWIAEKLAL